jgi:peptidoglycan hydrolase-like protein with peptidoglycan-binding domain
VPLVSKLFTSPFDAKLEACLVNDSAHIPQGSQGEHVRKIQIALNELSDGKVFLIIDGIYGPKTAAAVRAYKNAPNRRILGPGQTTADDIVGKRTIKSLDDEMDIFENESPAEDTLVSTTVRGSEHNHSLCPFSAFPAPGSEGRVNHFGLPINPLPGRKINLGGEGETKYLGFEDFVPNLGLEGPPRPLTSTIPSHSVTNICIRDAPISKDRSSTKGRDEIRRIAAPGCRFTFCGDVPEFRNELLSLGLVIQHMILTDVRFPQGNHPTSEVLVIIIR